MRFTFPLNNALNTVLFFMLGREPTGTEMITAACRMIPRMRDKVWS